MTTESSPRLTKFEIGGYLFLALLILLTFLGTLDNFAIEFVNSTQKSTLMYTLALKATASVLTFIPDNDALAPYIDTFDRAGTVLFLATIVTTLQKTFLIMMNTPTFSIILVGFFVGMLANKLSNTFNNHITSTLKKTLIILLIVRFIMTAITLLSSLSVEILINSQQEFKEKQLEALNADIKVITDQKNLIENMNNSLDSKINELKKLKKLNDKKLKVIDIGMFEDDTEEALKIKQHNKDIKLEIEKLEDEKVGTTEFIDAASAKIKIAIANVKTWFENTLESMFTTLSIIIIKIFIFPFLSLIIFYKFALVVIKR